MIIRVQGYTKHINFTGKNLWKAMVKNQQGGCQHVFSDHQNKVSLYLYNTEKQNKDVQKIL